MMLHARGLTVSACDSSLKRELFALFESHYLEVAYDRFLDDLSQKDRVLILHESSGRVAGFTALTCYDVQEPFPCRLLYSGDTIVDPRWWGRNDLVMAFFREAGRRKAEDPERTLYWSVILNGFRTWRILPTAFRAYWPNPWGPLPRKIGELRDRLGRDWFGNAFDPETGLVRFPRSIGHVRPEIAHVPDRLKARPDIEFFIRRNPGYRDGDELFCLAEFSLENLRSAARRNFRAGLEEPRKS